MIIRYLSWDGLLNQGVSDFSKATGELTACKNCYCYEIGKLEKVPGYTFVHLDNSASPSVSPSV